jgi:alkylation response protein AidB-like acyl-CoA dehydrogenase
MDIQFIATEEQRMLRDSVVRWAGSDRPKDESAWKHFAEMGWLMAALPEEAGGLGGSVEDGAIIAEELGRAMVGDPYVEIAIVAAQLLLKLASERVAAIADGSFRPILAHDEAEARGHPHWVQTRAARHGDAWRLTGRKTGIVGVDTADTLLITAIAAGHGLCLFELPIRGAPLKHFRTIDTRSGGELLLDATPATLVGPLGGAEAAILHALDCALVLESAEAVGSMDRVLKLTRDYLLTRHQFGRPIAEFQVLRHRLADMFIELEQARAIVALGLSALRNSDPHERSRIASATRARTAQAAAFVSANGIQLHGGIGVTEEYPVGHYFKRLTAFSLRHGTAEVQVERFAALSQPRQREPT